MEFKILEGFHCFALMMNEEPVFKTESLSELKTKVCEYLEVRYKEVDDIINKTKKEEIK